MWIMTQNKDELVNCDVIEIKKYRGKMLTFENDNEKGVTYKICGASHETTEGTECSWYYLGNYRTEEQARIELLEISYNIASGEKIYYMKEAIQ